MSEGKRLCGEVSDDDDDGGDVDGSGLVYFNFFFFADIRLVAHIKENFSSFLRKE